MLTVGITGGIGAGKTTICEIFAVLGISVYNADDRARYLMRNDSDLKKEIIKEFGAKSYVADDLNRNHLAKIVFSDSNRVEKLNTLVHPVVANDFQKWKVQQKSDYVIKEAALLIESESYKDLDVLINITASLSVRIDRVLKRDPFRSKEEILEIIKKQTSEETRNKHSHHNIDNNGSELIIPQIREIHKLLLRKSKN